MVRIHLLIFCLVFSNSLLAQKVPPDTIRHEYVRQYPDHWFVWPVIKHRVMSFDVQKRNESNEVLNYKPNNTVSMGLGVYVFEVSAELSLAVPLNEKSRTLYGESDVRDLTARLNGRYWGLDFFTQRYSSFYLANPSKQPKGSEVYPIRPDVSLRNVGMSGIYAFNKSKFSLRSAYNFAERQLKSAGSVMLAGTFNSVRLRSDSVLIGKPLQTRLKTTDTFTGLTYTTISLAPGYSYNLIFGSLFLNATLSIGPAHHWVNFEDAKGQPNYDITINTFVDGRLAIGYNSDHWFGGISYVSQSRQVRFDQYQFTTANSSFRMLVGYRIAEEGLLKKRAWDFIPRLSR